MKIRLAVDPRIEHAEQAARPVAGDLVRDVAHQGEVYRQQVELVDKNAFAQTQFLQHFTF